MFAASRPICATGLPRFFSGALFPEAIAEKLMQLEATLGFSGTGIWVPRSLLVNGKFGGAIRLQPNARLVDVLTLCPSESRSALEILGPHTVLAHVQHTTSPRWFHKYLHHLGESICSDSLAAADHEATINDDVMPYIPLTATGGLHRPTLADVMVAKAQEYNFTSPWWIPASWVDRAQPLWPLATPGSPPAVKHNGAAWYNTDQTQRPGAFCARNAALNGYEPHSIYGGQFPRLLEQQMQRVALRHDWNHRLWLTLDEAARFDAHLQPGETSHVMTSTMCRGEDGGPSVYYCASQFHDPGHKLPVLRAIQLIGSGVVRDGACQRAFDPMFGAKLRPWEAWAADLASQTRNSQLAPIASSSAETERMGAVLTKPLQQHSVLCSFRSPFYVSSHEAKRLPNGALPLKPTARGRCIHGRNVAAKEAMYFNAEDFLFPALAAAFVALHPVHLLTQTKFFGSVRLKMLQRMAEEVQKCDGKTDELQTVCRYWVPVDFLEAHAFEVPSPSQKHRVSHHHDIEYLTNRPWGNGDDESRMGANVVGREFLYVPDVPDPDHRLEQLCKYIPRRLDGSAIMGTSRHALLSKCLSHNLLHKDPRWVSVGFLHSQNVDTSTLEDMAVAVNTQERRENDDARSEEDCSVLAENTLIGDNNTLVAAVGRTLMYPLCAVPDPVQQKLVHAVHQRMTSKHQTKYNKKTVPAHQRVVFPGLNTIQLRSEDQQAMFQAMFAVQSDPSVL